MGNCTGAGLKGKHLKSFDRPDSSNQQNIPPKTKDVTKEQRITYEEANKRREELRRNLMESEAQPPRFFVHKIQPISKKYCQTS